MNFIIESRNAPHHVRYVVAPKGYHRLSDGTVARDGTPSPEMGPVQHAYKFKSHRSAALTANAMAFPDIREINY